MRRIVTLQEARASGRRKFYFTGKPCAHGHIAQRWVSNTHCVECKALRGAAHYAKHRIRILANRGPQRDRRRAAVIKWAKANPKKVLANNAVRRALKLNQLCKCCTPAAVAAVYAHCPRGHEVDHKIPLRVGGLHCVHNLQYLSEAEHKVKTKADHGAIADLRWFEKTIAPGLK